MSTTVDILCFISTSISVVKGKYALSLNLDTMIQCWDLNFANHTHFQSLEVGDHGCETQLQKTENLG